MTDADRALEWLRRSYALESPEEAAACYDAVADDYDDGFAAPTGYIYPREVAHVFLAVATASDAPVLDLGAGTGLVAEHLRAGAPKLEVDGIDISPRMLEQAAAKGLYRRRIVADLTRPLPIPDATYGAFVSAGLFTHGHVGAVVLPELLRIARPGALFCLGINPDFFDGARFGSAFARLVAAGLITPVDFREVERAARDAPRPYTSGQALVALFRRR